MSKLNEALMVDCPDCNACEGDSCFEPDAFPCSCGWVGCRTHNVAPHPARTKAAEAFHMTKPELATTAYTLGRGHTCVKCETSNTPCILYAQAIQSAEARKK